MTRPPDAASDDPDRTRVFTRLCRAGWGVLIIAAIIVLGWLGSHSPVEVAAAGALLGAVAFDLLVARRSLRDVEVLLTPPPDAIADRPLQASLRVQGHTRPVTISGVTHEQSILALAIDSSNGMINLPPPGRGIKRYLTLNVLTIGPLGLAEGGRRMRVRFPLPLRVGPASFPHTIDWPSPRAYSMALSPTSQIGVDLVRGIRPYRRGDSRRRVHWKASAHHGSLMVTEADGLGVVTVRLIVELSRRSAGAEFALSRATHIGEEVLRKGWRIELITRQPTGTDLPAIEPYLPSPFTVISLFASQTDHFLSSPPLEPAVPAVEQISTSLNLRRSLATASIGHIPDYPDDGVLTCRVTVGSVSWEG